MCSISDISPLPISEHDNAMELVTYEARCTTGKPEPGLLSPNVAGQIPARPMQTYLSLFSLPVFPARCFIGRSYFGANLGKYLCVTSTPQAEVT
jgi:hypothetical protein